MAENDENLLYGSLSLTAEEIALRAALSQWCRERLADGARPVALEAALAISAKAAKRGDAGFFEGGAADGRKPAPLRSPREAAHALACQVLMAVATHPDWPKWTQDPARTAEARDTILSMDLDAILDAASPGSRRHPTPTSKKP